MRGHKYGTDKGLQKRNMRGTVWLFLIIKLGNVKGADGLAAAVCIETTIIPFSAQ